MTLSIHTSLIKVFTLESYLTEGWVSLFPRWLPTANPPPWLSLFCVDITDRHIAINHGWPQERHTQEQGFACKLFTRKLIALTRKLITHELFTPRVCKLSTYLRHRKPPCWLCGDVVQPPRCGVEYPRLAELHR